MALKSNDVLIQIGRQPYMVLDDLWRGFTAWKDAEEDARHEFSNLRIDLVTNHSKKVDFGYCSTSGSTGKPKNYKWGPRFHWMIKFMSQLSLDGIDRDCIITLCPHVMMKELHVRRFNNKANDIHVVFDVLNHTARDILECCSKLGKKIVISGFPSVLSRILQGDAILDYLDRIVAIASTGEYVTPELYEKATNLNIPFRNNMRCYDGGATFITCPFGNEHWVDFLSHIRIGNDGKLISTDYFNIAQPFIDYWNGDIVSKRLDNAPICQCGLTGIGRIHFVEKQHSIVELYGQSYEFQYLKMRLGWALALNVKKVDESQKFILKNYATSFKFGFDSSNLYAFYEADIPDNFSIDHHAAEVYFAKSIGFPENSVTIHKTPFFLERKEAPRVFWMPEKKSKELLSKRLVFKEL